jgi:hypothetical protein
VDTAGKELGVLVSSLARSLRATALKGHAVALVLETLGSDQTLDLGGLGVFGLALLGDGTADDELADVVLLVEAEEAANLGGTLGTETLGDDGVGQTGKLTLTLLDDGEGQDGKVEVGDGTTNGLALALTGAAGAVAAVAIAEEQAGTSGKENTLLHGETLLVVTTGDLEDVTLEFVTEGVAGNFGSHALLHEGTELALVIDLDDLLRPIGRVGDVELHLDLTGAARSRQRRGLRFCRQVGDVFFKPNLYKIKHGLNLLTS